MLDQCLAKNSKVCLLLSVLAEGVVRALILSHPPFPQQHDQDNMSVVVVLLPNAPKAIEGYEVRSDLARDVTLRPPPAHHPAPFHRHTGAQHCS